MRMLRMYAAITTLLACSAAHPAYQHQFHNILDRNPCLKKCFDVVGKADQELNLIKAANVSGYMLNLGQICGTIDTSRKCVDACGEKSNPFALRTMREVCTRRVFDELQMIGECLFEEGDEIFDACRNACGNYDEMNKQVADLTNAMKSTPNDPVKVAEVMTKTNEACATLKCSHRCTVAQYTETCGPMYRDGRDVGAIVKSLIERVLLAQRRDLDEMGLTDQMAQTMPTNCNYMYMPEVMFNSTKDELAQLALEDAIREERSRQKDVVIPTEQPQTHQPTQGELNLALARMQAMVLRKQLQLLDMQEQNVRRESYKLDMEMNLLRKKQISL